MAFVWDPTNKNLSLNNNTLNGKPLIYLLNQKDMVIRNNSAGYILIGCSNIIFEGLIMDNWTNGIFIHSSENIIIDRCILHTKEYNLNIQNCINITITNSSTCATGRESGVSLCCQGEQPGGNHKSIYCGAGRHRTICKTKPQCDHQTQYLPWLSHRRICPHHKSYSSGYFGEPLFWRGRKAGARYG